MLLLGLLALTLVCLVATGCGGAGKPTNSNRAGAQANIVVSTPTKYDSDDAPVRFYGHEASAAERQAITALVTRYYAAAAREDGAAACPLIHSLIAEAIPENYGRLPRMHGKTCATIMSKMFKQRHKQLLVDSSTLEVTSVRVEGNKALVLLRFAKAAIPNHTTVHREGSSWKVWELFDSILP